MEPTRDSALLEVAGLSKSFPGLKALSDVSLTVRAGELVALVGQNGSGKSTLVKVLAGVHKPDPGSEIVLGDGPGGQAELHFIHQDLGLVPTLSTVENLGLGRGHGRAALLPTPLRKEKKHAQELVSDFGADFDVTRPVIELAAAERAIVAIARALDGWQHPHHVLVLDEPTASLHGDEVHTLFTAVRRAAARGAGVIFISHRLDEVTELADRVVVLRDGILVADTRRGDFDHDDLVRLIAGAIASPGDEHRRSADRRTAVLRARGLHGETIRSLDLDIHAGEVVGISGVLGSGREQVASILFGVALGGCDDLEVDGRPLRGVNPQRAIAAGVGYVPGDRHRHGAVMTLTARENITLPRLGSLRGRLGRIRRRTERREVRDWIAKVEVRPPDAERELRLFSGGNQQKVVLAKWLRNNPRVLLMDEPTQGVDVGAKTSIFKLITDAADQGAGLLICSSDAKELALICDRVLVMRGGEQVAEVCRPQLSEETLVRAGLRA